jgi:branched-chain amino acid transport system permease protein
LISPQLIARHRARPLGPHDDDLSRVLNYFRRAAVADKYAILALRPLGDYQLVRLSGERGVAPGLVDETIYDSEEDAHHAVFLRRVADLLAQDETANPARPK